MKLLRIWIDATWPEAGLSCPWALCGEDGEVLASGASGPDEWPAAPVLAILAPGQTSRLLAALPDKARSHADILAYAVEDRVADDTARLQLACEAPLGNLTPVTVIDRARLGRIVAALRRAGRPALHACDADRLGHPPRDHWRVRVDALGGCARLCDGALIGLDQHDDGDPPVALLLALDRARARAAAPAAIDVESEEPIDTAAWTQRLGLPVHQAPGADWRRQSFDPAGDLLQGDFAPAGSGGGRLRWLRRTALLALAMLAVAWLALLARWGLASWQLRALVAEESAVAAAALPPGTPLLEPRQQLRQALDQAMIKAGDAASDDWLLLHAAWLKAGGEAIPPAGLSYEGRQLTLTLPATRGDDVLAASRRAQAQGLTATWQPAPQGDSGTLTLTRSRP